MNTTRALLVIQSCFVYEHSLETKWEDLCDLIQKFSSLFF